MPNAQSPMPDPQSPILTHNSSKERYYSVCQLRVMVCKDSDRY
ncbi:MAG: hypothetical protein RM368_28505 [Nostoc sp. DedSLP03]|nr:hypothetical protein [Nostoc sp. DedSLP03]MDZ7968845.1 hypothetical protein [Nostoc sp. DedSLP03]